MEEDRGNDASVDKPQPILQYGHGPQKPSIDAVDENREARDSVCLAFVTLLLPPLSLIISIMLILRGIKMYQTRKLSYGPWPYIVIASGCVTAVVSSLMMMELLTSMMRK